MNIYDIKNKANEVLRQPNQLFKVILYVGIIQALFSALSGLFDGILGSIISLILSILTVTLGHGIIVASLKVVNNNGNLVDEKEDSLVGIKRFGQLFPTYFCCLSGYCCRGYWNAFDVYNDYRCTIFKFISTCFNVC